MLRVVTGVLLLAVMVPAQEPKEAQPVKKPDVQAQDASHQRPAADAAAPMFYKAFYLWHGEQKQDEALALYRQFLAAAPKSEYAGKAARDAVAILHMQDKSDQADELQHQFADAIAALPPEEQRRDGTPNRGWGGGPPGGARGGRMSADFTTMSDDEIKQHLEQMDRFVPMMLDRMRQRSGEEEANAAEKKWQHVKELLKEGDKEAAQKEWESLSESMRTRRRGGDR